MREHLTVVSKEKRILAGANLPAFQTSSSFAVIALAAGVYVGHHQKKSDDDVTEDGKISMSSSGVSGLRRMRNIFCYCGFVFVCYGVVCGFGTNSGPSSLNSIYKGRSLP